MATNIVKVNLESPRTVDSIAALEALNVSRQTGTVYLDAGGRSGWFKWDSSPLSTEVSNDTQQGIYVAPSSDATGASGAWVRSYTGSIYVDWFGSSADGVTDDSTAIQAAIDYVKANPTFNLGSNTTPRGGTEIKFSSGIYRVDSTIDVNQLNGVTVSGQGQESTMLMWTGGSGSMISMNQNLHTTWQNFGVVSATGPVTINSSGKPNIPTRNSSSYLGTAWGFDGTGAGGAQYNKWKNILCDGGFNRIFYAGGLFNQSENSWITCDFFSCNYVFYSENPQSVDNSFTSCNVLFIKESVFYFLAGGNLSVHGGAYINPKDTLTLAGPSSSIGQNNGQFTFYDVRFELYQNIDATSNPYLVRQFNVAKAFVSFINCSATAASDASKDIVSVQAGSTNLVFDNCKLIGVVNVTPSDGFEPFLKFVNCSVMPTINSTVTGGSKYTVITENCWDSTGNNLNTIDFKKNKESLNYSKQTLYYRYFANVSSAGNVDVTFSTPENIIITDVWFTIDRPSAVNLTVELYVDSGRTVQLFSQNTGSSLIEKLWKAPIVSYSGDTLSSYLVDGTLYPRIVSAGNVGVIDLTMHLEYFQFRN